MKHGRAAYKCLSLYCDPGGIIEKEKLGEIGHGSLDKIIQSMGVLKNSTQFAQKVKAYVEKNHIINAEKIKQINQVTNELYKTEKIK